MDGMGVSSGHCLLTCSITSLTDNAHAKYVVFPCRLSGTAVEIIHLLFPKDTEAVTSFGIEMMEIHENVRILH